MLKRFVVYIIIILFTNSVLLIPKASGIEIYDTRGHRNDQIGSFAEFFYQIILGNEDKTPEEEDGKTNNTFLIQKINSDKLFQEVVVTPVKNEILKPNPHQFYSVYIDTNIYDGVINITTPPPKV